MLRQRVIVTAILLPIGLALIVLGGVAFTLFIALILAIAAWEYAKIFKNGSHQPAEVIVIVGTAALTIGRGISGFQHVDWILGLIIIASMIYHMIAYERGRDKAGTDFSITISGIVYVGWLGAYLVSLRNLPNGAWWFMVSLPSIWAADSGAYFYGIRYGKRKLSPRLSPKKTVEGYLAGVVCGPIFGVAFSALAISQVGGEVGFSLLRGGILGLILAIFTTLGDLGESMFKRQFGVKDSSHLLPGHGGVFDRIDSWIWGASISYYIITLFFN
jgi:phosphatidate cytidylyltransferase